VGSNWLGAVHAFLAVDLEGMGFLVLGAICAIFMGWHLGFAVAAVCLFSYWLSTKNDSEPRKVQLAPETLTREEKRGLWLSVAIGAALTVCDVVAISQRRVEATGD
jgi:hypothetical protein